MPRKYYKLIVEYEGTEFSGWQLQQNARTVQFELEKALASLFQEKIRVTASGRTDAGVHALGQVAGFSAQKRRTLDEIRLGLNALLPEDVSIHSVEEVGEMFHPRFNAKRRSYIYKICPHESAIQRRFTWFLRESLNITNMQLCADMILGKHDFQSFCSSNAEVNHYFCTIECAKWDYDNSDLLEFFISANRFLHNMVRILVGTMVEVGRGKISVEEFKTIILKKDRNAAGPTAPAQGLFLVKVEY